MRYDSGTGRQTPSRPRGCCAPLELKTSLASIAVSRALPKHFQRMHEVSVFLPRPSRCSGTGVLRSLFHMGRGAYGDVPTRRNRGVERSHSQKTFQSTLRSTRSTGLHPNPYTQNSPKTFHNKAFGPKYLKIRLLGALRKVFRRMVGNPDKKGLGFRA